MEKCLDLEPSWNLSESISTQGHFQESVDDPDVFEKEFMKYLKEQGYELDDSINEEVIGFGEILPKGEYTLANDILNKEEEELSAKRETRLLP